MSQLLVFEGVVNIAVLVSVGFSNPEYDLSPDVFHHFIEWSGFTGLLFGRHIGSLCPDLVNDSGQSIPQSFDQVHAERDRLATS